MSEPSGFPQYAGATSQMRTLAVRITDDLRAQLDVIAQLNDRSVTRTRLRVAERWTRPWAAGGFHSFATRALVEPKALPLTSWG